MAAKKTAANRARTIVSACSLDCPDGCSLLVKTAGGLITGLTGNPAHPITRGRICPRPFSLMKLSRDKDRPLYPSLRTKGGRQRLSWDDALDLVARKLEPVRNGRGNGFAIQGSGSLGVTRHAVRHFCRLLGLREHYGSLCDGSGIEAFRLDAGELEMSDPREILHARGIILWGKKPEASSPHTALLLREALRKGVPLVVISPCRTAFSRLACLDIRLRPGEDASLAALVCRLVLESRPHREEAARHSENMDDFSRLIRNASPKLLASRADVRPAQVRALADFLRDRSPVSVLIAQGLQRYRHGCDAVRAINALVFLSGNMGRPGGGSFYNVSSSRNLDLSWMATAPDKSLSLPRISLDLADPRHDIRFAWIGASNLANQAPDCLKTAEALERVPFTVVLDGVMNDTARVADLVLPVALMFERTDVVSTYGHDFLAYARKAVDAPGEALSDFEIVERLARLMGIDLPWHDLEDFHGLVTGGRRIPGGAARLKERGFTRARRPLVAYRGCRFPRPGGRFRFLDRLPPAQHDPDYPLQFITAVQAGYQHSQIPPGEQRGEIPVRVHPATAAAFGLASGEHVFIKSPLGLLPAILRTDAGLHPDVALAPRGGWMNFGRGVNAIIAPEVCQEGHTAAYYQQRVTLVPAAPDWSADTIG